MRLGILVLAVCLASLAVVPAPAANATGCIYGHTRDCFVSVETVYCFTEPCDGIIVCVDHGAVCSNRLLP